MVSWSVNFRRVFFIVAPNKLRRCTERIGRMHGTYSTKKGCTEVQPFTMKIFAIRNLNDQD